MVAYSLRGAIDAPEVEALEKAVAERHARPMWTVSPEEGTAGPGRPA